jgi:hypothetical protein
VTLAKYTWAAGDTIGGRICIEDLTGKTKMMRRLRGEQVYAVVTLGDTFMPTKFGGRQRPHFIVKRWIALDGNAALPEAKAPALTGPAQQSDPVVGKPVAEPTTSEALDDIIPY